MLGETLANTMYVHAQSKKVTKLPNGKEKVESDFPGALFAKLVELPDPDQPVPMLAAPHVPLQVPEQVPEAPVQVGGPVQGAVEVEGHVLGPEN